MRGKPITKVEPLEDGILRVTFDTGNCVTIDMKPRLENYRFGVLQTLLYGKRQIPMAALSTGIKMGYRWWSWLITK